MRFLFCFFFFLFFSSHAQECSHYYTDFTNCSVKAIAHRGYSHIFPENSLEALEEAFQRGIKYAEIDVMTTTDSVAVLFHDQPRGFRTSNGNIGIQFSTFDEIKDLDYGSWKGSQFEGTSIATLAEAITLAEKYNAYLYLDTKGFSPKSYADALELSGGSTDRIFPALSDLDEITEFKSFLPTTPFVYFGDWEEHVNDAAWFQNLVSLGCQAFEIYFETALENGPTFQAFRDQVHNAGAELWVFTTNDPEQFTFLADIGVDGIETDIPWEMMRLYCSGMEVNTPLNDRCTGNWTFDQGNSFGQGVGSQFKHFHYEDTLPEQTEFFGKASDFGLPPLETTDVDVMYIPALNPDNGLMVYSNFTPTGEAGLHYDYTLILDFYLPTSSMFQWVSILQTNTFNFNDGDIFISPLGGIGINNDYHGAVLPNTYHRLVLAVDSNEINKYLDGVFIGSNAISGNRWSVVNTFPGGDKQGFLLFSDEDGETADVYVAAVQLRNYKISTIEAVQLGTAAPGGIPNMNSGIYSVTAPQHPEANFITDWENKTIYPISSTPLPNEITLQFDVPAGASANPVSGSTFVLGSGSIRVTGETGVHFTDWTLCNDPMSLSELDSKDLILFPNPSNAGFQLKNIPKAATHLRVVNATGQIVYDTTLDGSTNLSWNEDAVGEGIYFISLTGPQYARTLKWFKL